MRHAGATELAWATFADWPNSATIHAAALAAVQAHAAEVEKEASTFKRLADTRQVAKEEADERADAAERALEHERQAHAVAYSEVETERNEARAALDRLRMKARAMLDARAKITDEGGTINGCTTSTFLTFSVAAVDLTAEVGQLKPPPETP